MKIKFNHVQDLSDARYAAAAMAEWLGFRVGEIALSRVQEIIGWCTGPKLTLELQNPELKETAISWCDILQVDAIECSFDDLQFWQKTFTNKHYEWIVNHGNESTVILPEPITIHCIDLSTNTAEKIKEANYQAISLTCEKEQVVGMKNYDHWNKLLETLEIW